MAERRCKSNSKTKHREARGRIRDIKETETDSCKDPEESDCVGEMGTYLQWPEEAGILRGNKKVI